MINTKHTVLPRQVLIDASIINIHFHFLHKEHVTVGIVYNNNNRQLKVKVDRPLGLQVIEAVRIYRQKAQEGGKVVSPTHQPPLHARIYP
jgi:hypothetical protein